MQYFNCRVKSVHVLIIVWFNQILKVIPTAYQEDFYLLKRGYQIVVSSLVRAQLGRGIATMTMIAWVIWYAKRAAAWIVQQAGVIVARKVQW